jgi:hypothetical protein
MKVSFAVTGCGNNIGVFSLCGLHLFLLVIFYSTAFLSLSSNSLTGTIPSKVGLLTKLSELNVVWFLLE